MAITADNDEKAGEVPVWRVVVELGRRLGESEWEMVPADLARNLDHYLYGAPKED